MMAVAFAAFTAVEVSSIGSGVGVRVIVAVVAMAGMSVRGINVACSSGAEVRQDFAVRQSVVPIVVQPDTRLLRQ